MTFVCVFLCSFWWTCTSEITLPPTSLLCDTKQGNLCSPATGRCRLKQTNKHCAHLAKKSFERNPALGWFVLAAYTHRAHPHTLEWVIISFKMSFLPSRRQLCTAFNAAVAPDRLVILLKPLYEMSSSMITLMNPLSVCWYSRSWCFGGHFRYYNQVTSNSCALGIVFGPVHLMLPWAFNEGHIVEKGEQQCDFNRLTMVQWQGKTVIALVLSERII